MSFNYHQFLFKMRFIPKKIAIITIATLLTSCATTVPTKLTSTSQSNIQVTPSNKRIQTDLAKQFVPSSLSQYLVDDPQSINAFISSSLNVFESRDSKLIEKLQFLWGSSKNSKFTIIHFGDSHVQMGLAQQITRDHLQSSLGNGGRGIIFPYSIAKTYSQSDFISRYEGQWQYASSIQEYPKLPLGLIGFVAKTSDASSSFTISFKNQLPKGNNRIQLLYRVSSPNFSTTYYADNEAQSVPLSRSSDGMPLALDINVSNFSDTVKFDFINPSNDGGVLEIYGLNIEVASNSGVVYHNAGVGGATYGAVVAQSYFESQSSKVKPSLYILDYGTNDILYKNKISANLGSTVISTIKKIRTYDPSALILIMSPQSMYFKGRNITSTFELAKLLRKISLENDCLYYDWYRIAGGQGAMSTWYSYGLARKDHIHLTDKGYALKGYLLAKAFENTVNNSNEIVKIKAPLIEVNSEDVHSVSMWLKKESTIQFIKNDIIKPTSNSKQIKKKQ